MSNADVVAYAIRDGTSSEIGYGTYTSASSTLTRNVRKSTNSNAAISLSGNAEVVITPSAEDLQSEITLRASPTATVAGGTFTITGATTLALPSTILDLSGSGYASYIKFKDTAMTDTASWYVGAKGATYSGVEDHTFGIAYNFNPSSPANRVNTSQPAFSYNFEPNYKDGAGGQGLLEHNWSYTSTDGSVSYRPFGFNLNLTTHNAEWDWTGTQMTFRHRANAIGASTDALRIVPDGTAGGTTSINGVLRISGLAALSGGPILIDGTSDETLVQISPTSFADLQSAIGVSLPTGTYANGAYVMSAQAVVNTGYLLTSIRNTSASGGVLADMSADNAGAAGDVLVRMLSGSSAFWSFGIDASDSRKWKISRDSALGNNDTITLSSTEITAGVGLVAAAGTTAIAPFRYQSGTNLTSAVAGAAEFDGVQFYKTIDTSSGRGAVPVEQYVHLTADGSTISTIANFFGATSNISLVASAYYEIDIYCYFLKTTSDTVVWTLTNSAAPTSQNILYEMSPITGIVAPPGTATMLVGQVEKDATAAKTITTGTLTTAVEHFAHFKIWLQNGTGTSLKIQATATSGTITPRLGSRWLARRMAAGNVGTLAA